MSNDDAGFDATSDTEALEIAKAAIKAMAEDGWLYHGVEGMNEAQELCYQAYLKLGLKDAVFKKGFIPASETERNEYICKCGIRVVPHRCKTLEEF